MRILTRVVAVAVPLPFTDEEAEALIEYLELTIDGALQAVVDGILDAARGPHANLPLAASAIATVTE